MSELPPADDAIVEKFSGRFLSVCLKGHWEFVRRVNATGVTAIIAITDADEIVLVRQYRPPMAADVLELPAGLVGDEPDSEDESMAVAASRELLEETGFQAGKIEEVLTAASSAGLTDEAITFFLATELTREHAGGGVAGESIETIVVPLDEVDQYVLDCCERGCQLDAKLLTGLYIARYWQKTRPLGD